ncbi:hypothetical protein [Methanopyrus sp.]
MSLRCPRCGGPVRPSLDRLECEECEWSKELRSRPRKDTRLKWMKEYTKRFLREEFDDCGVSEVIVRGPRGRGAGYLAATVYVDDHHKAIGKDGSRVKEVEEKLETLADELGVPPVRITVHPSSALGRR